VFEFRVLPPKLSPTQRGPANIFFIFFPPNNHTRIFPVFALFVRWFFGPLLCCFGAVVVVRSKPNPKNPNRVCWFLSFVPIPLVHPAIGLLRNTGGNHKGNNTEFFVRSFGLPSGDVAFQTLKAVGPVACGVGSYFDRKVAPEVLFLDTTMDDCPSPLFFYPQPSNGLPVEQKTPKSPWVFSVFFLGPVSLQKKLRLVF